MPLADIRPALRAFLLADPIVSIAVGGERIYPTVLPQGIKSPSLVYNVISEVTDHTTEGASGLVMVRMQVDAYAAMHAGEPVVSSAQARVAKLTGKLGRSITVGTKLSRRQKRAAAETKTGVEVYIGAGPLPQAHMLEFGTSHQGPEPYLRPAVDANGKRIIETFRDDSRAEIAKAVQRLERKAARIVAKMKG
jgi:HK97 gp10 family phage protein